MGLQGHRGDPTFLTMLAQVCPSQSSKCQGGNPSLLVLSGEARSACCQVGNYVDIARWWRDAVCAQFLQRNNVLMFTSPCV